MAKNSEMLSILAIFIIGFISSYIDSGNSSTFDNNSLVSSLLSIFVIILINCCLSSYEILGLFIISVIFS